MYKILPLMLLVTLKVTAQEQTLEGVWELVSAQHQYEDNGPIINLKRTETFKSFKILKDGYYSILTQDPNKTIFGAHMGTYTVEHNNYSENFIVHKQADQIGKSASFTFKIEDGKWFIYSNKIVEVWQRVKPAKSKRELTSFTTRVNPSRYYHK
ncbi:MAG: hypothetical protein OQK09_00355 [Colwellia sp.]|nr:hypothetical protein [Colwellia sp.]MCW8863504.1 hypothetical protein [Colwellia sp.]MCW9079938.1 hypothetical protein [Colwellia sp.]